MTILERLINLGFIEGTDFSLEGDVLTALEKTRDVEQVIHHDEVPEITEEQEVLDENGASYDPPRYETVVTQEFVAAYDETVIVQETYTELLPSVEELKSECVKTSDVALLISEYLADKVELRDEGDSLNIVDGSIHRWDFKNIPCPSISELYTLIVSTSAKLEQKEINAAALKYLAETDWLIVRELDSGEPCPAEVKAERAAARARIVK
jgi:hypothetical protein